MSDGPRHVAIVGATGTGKTALACELARRLPAVELVSVDAMSVYAGMDIGTAKPTASELSAAPWHLLDLVDPSDEFSVADFQVAAERVIASVEGNGGTAVLVGGTGLYHRSIVDSLSIPGRYPDVVAELDPQDTARLFDRLALLDAVAASRMTPGNRRRIVRALEVTIGSGRPFSSYGPGLEAYPESRFVQVGLDIDRPELAVRLEKRLDEQLAAGFVEEVRRLLERPGGLSRTARQALGYRELLTHVEEGVPLEAARSETLRRTRLFAKRQQSWFRRDPRITWFDAVRPDLADAVAEHVERSLPVHFSAGRDQVRR
ncbi:MAG TPA: tRNA (adenosine(37)-N6)-dimethylallyltransferase MiaA [Acidimicrobiales bacterium]|nr:tRNA (adenosine(37)-N6)-dimethylallyltransferase MiaA [Acidimicrobiales bacterium]